MFIDDEKLREALRDILLLKTRNQVVNEIKDMGYKFHQYNIDRFLDGRPISIETLKKVDKYINRSSNY